jgi:predicted small secreted protein
MHNFLGIRYKTDNFRKGVFTDPYDEPTFLTFAIDFKFEDTAASVITSHHLWDSPLFNEKSGSALKFLENRGYADDAHGVKVFKEILRYLTFDAPWYFQSISGLNGMWKQATDMASGNKTKGTSLTIETLEAVDLRITELASIYRKAMFDKVHMREKVPDNLRWFAMDIYIAEARNLRYRLPGIGQNTAQLFGVNTAAIGNVLGGGNILSNVLEQYGYVKFRCRQCEFDFSDSFAGGSKLDVTTTNKPATNSFKINVGYFEEETRFADGSRIFDDLIRSEIENPWSLRNVGTDIKNAGSFLSGLPLIGDDIQRAGQKVQSAFAQVGGLLNPALGAASQFIDPPVKTLGNAYRR